MHVVRGCHPSITAEPAVLPPLIQAMCNPALFGNPKGGVRLAETHISWVILTGEYAYKIKKPVEFGFLDYSTLALRHKFCQEELRLNRRLAPFLYISVVSITDEHGSVGFDGPGPVLEYAVKLRQFDEDCLADRLLGQNCITNDQIDRLALILAEFHGKAERAGPSDAHGNPETILAAAEHNFDTLLRLGNQLDFARQASSAADSRYQPSKLSGNALTNDVPRLDALSSWTRSEFQRLGSVFRARKNDGFVRECHGDLHSGNLVLIDGELIPFDCIEFSEDLRWIDCISEIAFLFMDMDERGQSGLAWRLLNRYLAVSGDYAGLEVMHFYCVYRALVRAKVDALSLEGATEPGIRSYFQTQCQRYLDYASQTREGPPIFLITHGFSGSGKSYHAQALAERLPAIRIASDIERKRLTGPALSGASGKELRDAVYSESMTRKTYGLLFRHAGLLLRSGYNVILDATFLLASNRRQCRELAGCLGIRFFILDFPASKEVLSERIAMRLTRGGDPSEVGHAVLPLQAAKANPLETEEIPYVLTIDTTVDKGIDKVMKEISGSQGQGRQHSQLSPGFKLTR